MVQFDAILEYSYLMFKCFESYMEYLCTTVKCKFKSIKVSKN